MPGHARPFRVVVRDFDGARVDVAGRNGYRRHGQTPPPGGIEEAAPGVGGPVAEALESVAFAVEAGSAPHGHPRGLDGEGAAAAHGAREGVLGGVPAGFEEDGGREVFAQGRDPRTQAVAAARERDAAGVEVQPRHAIAPVEGDAGGAFGVGLRIGTRAGLADETVGDGVLAPEEGEARIAQSGRLGVAVEMERCPGREPFLPRERGGGGVEFVGVPHAERSDLEQHPVGAAEPEVELEGFAQVALDADRRGREVARSGMPERGEFAAEGAEATASAGDGEGGWGGPVHGFFTRPLEQKAGTNQRRK